MVLNGEGKVLEQGYFKNLATEGGYISSFNLPPPDWTYGAQKHTKYDMSKQSLVSADDSSIENLDLPQSPESLDDRRTGDFATYVYYVKAVGVIPTLFFVFAISTFVFCLSFPSKSPNTLETILSF